MRYTPHILERMRAALAATLDLEYGRYRPDPVSKSKEVEQRLLTAIAADVGSDALETRLAELSAERERKQAWGRAAHLMRQHTCAHDFSEMPHGYHDCTKCSMADRRKGGDRRVPQAEEQPAGIKGRRKR